MRSRYSWTLRAKKIPPGITMYCTVCCWLLWSCDYMPPEFFCSNWANRCVIRRDVSMKRSTQFARQVSVALSSLDPGFPMHLSQQISLNSWIYKENISVPSINRCMFLFIICHTCAFTWAFCFSIIRNSCNSLSVDEEEPTESKSAILFCYFFK